MALTSRAVAVATTATRLDTAAETDGVHGSKISVHNNGAATVFVGASDVTITNGYPIAAGASLNDMGLDISEGLYGVVAAATVDCRVLETSV